MRSLSLVKSKFTSGNKRLQTAAVTPHGSNSGGGRCRSISAAAEQQTARSLREWQDSQQGQEGQAGQAGQEGQERQERQEWQQEVAEGEIPGIFPPQPEVATDANLLCWQKNMSSLKAENRDPSKVPEIIIVASPTQGTMQCLRSGWVRV